MALTKLLELDPTTYEPHRLHQSERIWNETNCYVDLWIEVLHSLGLEPLAAAAFTLATDFETEQWTFFKFPPEELQTLFGIRVYEMNPWRTVLEHVIDHLASGRLITVEVDAWYLPDTAGVAYRRAHTKTTIVPNAVDPEQRRLGYFHNASYFELEGDDFDGVFRLGDFSPDVLVPYVETIRLDLLERPSHDELIERAKRSLARQLELMPDQNPIVRLRERTLGDVEWLQSVGLDGFHLWAFGMFRQCGSSAEVAAEHLTWLSANGGDEVGFLIAADALRSIAQGCKSLEFSMARAARGRTVDVSSTFDEMEQSWATARTALVSGYER
ncbi:MAG: DUF1839 family protein [Salinibacterium sp.]|nr:DUF1839 family protein [Salinibacterium sp.]